MKYTYACKKVPLNDSIKDYAEKRVEKLEKYFHRDDASAFVTFTVEKDKLCTVEITIRDGSTLLRAQTTEPDATSSATTFLTTNLASRTADFTSFF